MVPPAVSPPPRRSRRWRVALVVALLVVIAAWVLRGPLLGPVVASRLASTLSGALGGEVTVRRAGGGWLGDAEVEGVASPAPLPGAVRKLEVERLAIRHRVGLLGGDITALESVEAKGVRVEIGDTPDDGSPSTGTWPPVLDWFPDPLPRLDVSGSFLMELKGERLDVPGLSLVGGDRRLVVSAKDLTAHGLPPQDLTLDLERRGRATLVLKQPATIAGITVDRLELTMGRSVQGLVAGADAWDGRADVTVTPDSLSVNARDLDLAQIPAALIPAAIAEWAPFAGRVTMEVAAKRDAGAPGGWAVGGSVAVAEGRVADRDFRILDAKVRLTAGGVHVDGLAIEIGGGVRVRVESMDVARLAGRWLPLRGTATVTIDDLRPWLAPVNVPPEWMPGEAVAVDALVSLETGMVTVERLRLTTVGLGIDVSGALATLTRRIGQSECAVRGDLGKLARHVPALAGASGTVDATLRYAGRVPRDLATLLASDVQVTLTGADLEWRGRQAKRVSLAARCDDGTVRVNKAEIETDDALVSLDGRVGRNQDEWEGVVERLAASWRGLDMATSATMPFRVGPDAWSAGPFAATVAGGTIAVTATSTPTLFAAATGIDLAPVGRAMGRALVGQVSATVDVSGDPAKPTITLMAQGKGLRAGDYDATLDLAVEQDASGIHVRRCAVDLAGSLRMHGKGSWPAVVGRDGIATVVGAPPPDLTLDAEVADLSVFAGRVLAGGGAALALRSVDGTTMTGDLALRGVRLRHADAERAGRRIAAPKPLDADVALRLDQTGATIGATAALDGRPILNGELTSMGALDPRAVRARPITGHATLDRMPLDALLGAVPGLLQGTGRVSGSLTAGGTLAEPALEGVLNIDEGAFKVTSELPTITGVHGDIALKGRRLEVRGLNAELGFEKGLIEGTIDLEPAGPVFDLALTGKNLLLAQNRDLRLRADTDLRVSGPLSSLLVAGSVTITNALYSRRVELIGGRGGGGPQDDQVQLFAIRDPPLSDMRFDVDVRTSSKRGDEGLRVTNNLVRATATVGMRLRGTGALPQPEGSVLVREALVTLPLSTLSVERAEVVFPHNDPFVPTINAVARAQVRQYSVTVDVQGPLRDPEIHAASAGLEERDALLLLTAGATTAELEDPDGQRAALGRVGTWLGRETWRLISGPGDPDAGPTPLDLITVEIGRTVSQSGRDTIEAEMRLNQLSDPYGIYLSGERDRYDDYNMGFILRLRFGGGR